MTTIIDNGGGGSGAGILAGILVVVLLVVGFFLFANTHGGSGSVDIGVPKVKVDVVPDGQ